MNPSFGAAILLIPYLEWLYGSIHSSLLLFSLYLHSFLGVRSSHKDSGETRRQIKGS